MNTATTMLMEAERFEQAASELRHAADTLSGINRETVRSGNGIYGARRGIGSNKKSGISRLSDVLKDGPMYAKEIVGAISMPRSTLYGLYNRNKGKFSRRGGKWRLKKEVSH